MHPDLERLARIDALDRELKELARSQQSLRARHQEARQAVEGAAQEVGALEARIEATRDEERAAGRQVHQYQQRRASAVRVLEAGTGDPDAAQRQLEQCDQILDEIETTQLELMERQDALNHALVEAQAAHQRAREALERADAELPPQQQALKEEERQRTQTRDAELQQLEPHLSERYHQLVARRGSAVAPIVGGACKACRMVVQTQHLTDLRRGLIAPCRGCNRWLLPPASPEPAA